jgi:hypothetical protein
VRCRRSSTRAARRYRQRHAGAPKRCHQMRDGLRRRALPSAVAGSTTNIFK